MNLLLHNVGPTVAQLDARRRALLADGMPPDQGDVEIEELLARDKINLDLFPEPDAIAAEIADDLRSALEQIEAILGDLHTIGPVPTPPP
jgi:hypothetical protein